jgi:hypothetical protein
MEVSKMGCDIHPYLEIKEKRTWKLKEPLNLNRDYDMFGILAEVRNYVNAKPISEQKGFPKDASVKVRQYYEDYNDGHSASFLTWKEISEYDWNQVSTDGRISVVDVATGEELYKASYGSEWEDKEKLAKEGHRLENKQRVMKDLISMGYQALFDKMKVLSEKYGAENVRLVFWFDA